MKEQFQSEVALLLFIKGSEKLSLKLTRLQGVVYAWCMNNNCEFNTLRPTQWRKRLNFNQGKRVKRDKLKEQSVKYLFDNYKLNVSDDKADAICIADAVLKMFGESSCILMK